MPSQSKPGKILVADAATAFAPATVANVAVGFDLLGFALDAVGDTVRVSAEPADCAQEIIVESITGVVTDLPTDPARNTASVALRSLIDELGLTGRRFRIALDKGIALGSGMGGSAASAVGAVVAANALLARPLSRAALLPHALRGEEAASGAPHADNAAPCLFGGMTAVVASDPIEIVELPVPPGVGCVLVRPEIRVDTHEARAALRPEIPLEQHVQQSMRLAGFLAGCFRGEVELLGRSMQDLIAGPQRQGNIPGFALAREKAFEAGAFGFAIAGSGPSVFAWVRSPDDAPAVRQAVEAAFGQHDVRSQSWVSPLGCSGARTIDPQASRSRG